MGTSSSGGGPKGRTPLLPSWATESGKNPPSKDNGLNPDEVADGDSTNGSEESDIPSGTNIGSATSEELPLDAAYSSSWTPAKTSFRKFVNSKGSSGSLNNAARSYIKSMGGYSKATKAASRGISVGGGYIEFLGGIRRNGFDQTLQEYDLSDCLGKSTEEALVKIAGKIAPTGTTNDEIIARAAVMSAVDILYTKIIENGEGIEGINNVSEEVLKDSVIEYVSAYIYKKWIYELGLALEQNDLPDLDIISLESQVKNLVRAEVKASLKKKDILKLDFQKGEGKRIVENIFALAYSTLEK